MCSVSLESYHPYLKPQIVSKIQKIIAFIAACPKFLNSMYGTHKPNLWKQPVETGKKLSQTEKESRA
jgi:hypothetical protein